ncbi:MAG: hypothetical protein QG567_2216, partial [Campylobacterota bacterium]|nr:hypothetical protein [Campylobacterota bacterium]
WTLFKSYEIYKGVRMTSLAKGKALVTECDLDFVQII